MFDQQVISRRLAVNQSANTYMRGRRLNGDVGLRRLITFVYSSLLPHVAVATSATAAYAGRGTVLYGNDVSLRNSDAVQ